MNSHPPAFTSSTEPLARSSRAARPRRSASLLLVCAFASAALALLADRSPAQTPAIQSLSANGVLTCSNLAPETTAQIEWAPSLFGPWTNTWEGLQAVPADLTGGFQVPVPIVSLRAKSPTSLRVKITRL